MEPAKRQPREVKVIAQSIRGTIGAEIQTQDCGIIHYILLPQREELVSVPKEGSLFGWKDLKLLSQKAWAQALVLLSCVTSGKSLSLSELPHSPLENG